MATPSGLCSPSAASSDSTYATIASTLVLLSLFDFVVASCLVGWAAVTGQLPHVLGPSFDFGWAFHNPRTFLKVVGVVLAVAVVALLWFAEQIGDFRKRLAQGFAILEDWRAYLRGSRSGRSPTGRAGCRGALLPAARSGFR